MAVLPPFEGKLPIYKVDENNEKEFIDKINDLYRENKATAHAQVAEMRDGSKVLYVSAGAGKDEGMILQLSAGASASILHQVGKNGGIQTVSLDIIQTKANAWASGAGIGVGLSANLLNAKASVFDLNLGVGVDTGVGVHDDSVTLEAAGCGFTVGRKVGVSVLGNSFEVDFGRCSQQ